MEKFYDFGSRSYLTTFAASPELFDDAIECMDNALPRASASLPKLRTLSGEFESKHK